MNEKLVIKKEPKPVSDGWRPITVSNSHYENIKLIAEETNMPISKVATLLIEFALENVEIQK